MFVQKHIFLISIILLTLSKVYSQEAFKLAETTRLRCDVGEIYQADQLAVELINKPDAKGAIVYYGMKGNAARFNKLVKKYLIENRGISSERISAYYGGYGENEKMEFWIIPNNAKELRFNDKIDEEKATRFDKYYFEIVEYCGDLRESALKSFADVLKQYPNWRGYIIVYSSKNENDYSLSRRQARRYIEEDKRKLVKLGLKISQVTTVVAGYQDWAYAELWIVPKGAKLPILQTTQVKKKSSKKFRRN